MKKNDSNQIKKMIFWGSTGQAIVLRECMSHLDYKLVAIFDNNAAVKSPFADVPLYFGKKGFDEWNKNRDLTQKVGFLVAIGGDSGKDRIEIHNTLESNNLIPLIAKHPTAFVAESATIGLGSQILANSSVCVGVTIGKGCIINTGATVDHECVLEEGVHVCPGANLAGLVKVERFSTIGTGSVVLPRVTIGEGAVVGAGAVVLKNVDPHTVVVGNPARVLKK